MRHRVAGIVCHLDAEGGQSNAVAGGVGGVAGAVLVEDEGLVGGRRDDNPLVY